MIRIEDFTRSHREQAQHIALDNYASERAFAPSLPPIEATPDLAAFAENGLGVAALDGDRMIGFLCCVLPFQHAFRSTDAVGVFSPMGANGATGTDRAKTYALMYRAAGAKWAKAGASSHAICLYAHDREAQEQFFQLGFGMRCVDAMRGMDEIPTPPCPGYIFTEVASDTLGELLPLDHLLDAHMAASPAFILRPSETLSSFVEKASRFRARLFAAKYGGHPVAFLRAERDGETFLRDLPGYLHITGAFCLPEHRGKGLHQHLLNLLLRAASRDGMRRIGVDYESINPAAFSFWGKHFAAYTHSVVRRIDEHALMRR